MGKERKNKKKVKFYKKNVSGNNSKYRWIVGIVIWTFAISSSISYISDLLLLNVNLIFAFVILIIIILIGIFFDIVGVAVTAAEEAPFHSMASRKVRGARTSVYLIRNADKVSNFCNDVIGDVCGIISGGIGIVIINKILVISGIQNKTLLTLVISALIASATVGGKAMGKNFAISQSSNIVYGVSWIIETVRRR